MKTIAQRRPAAAVLAASRGMRVAGAVCAAWALMGGPTAAAAAPGEPVTPPRDAAPAQAQAQAQAQSHDARMLQLAAVSGCMQCHARWPGPAEAAALPAHAGQVASQAPGAAPDTTPVRPLAPAWSQIAARYRGQAFEETRLTRIVQGGSEPEEPHWRGKVSGLAMPEHATAIGEADARALVRWILSQQAPPAK